MEAGKGSLEIEARERAGNYLMQVLRMEDNRWPKICLKEELRGIRKNCSSKWEMRLKKVFEEVGDGEVINWMPGKEKTNEVERKLVEGIKTKRDQEIQFN